MQDLRNKVFLTENSIHITDLIRNENKDESEKFEYLIEFSPFKVIQKSNGIVTQVINPEASLYFEDTVEPSQVSTEVIGGAA